MFRLEGPNPVSPLGALLSPGQLRPVRPAPTLPRTKVPSNQIHRPYQPRPLSEHIVPTGLSLQTSNRFSAGPRSG